jgi:uncharacterized lipoprotein
MQSNKFSKLILITLSSIFLSACSIMDKSDYATDISKKATTAHYIMLPADMKSSKIESYYPIPKLTAAQQKYPTKVSVVPPGSSLAKLKK